MKELVLPADLTQRLESLYVEMEKQYNNVARALEFGCEGCSDNCCDSYFLHHTHAEWAYLRQGFLLLDQEQQETVLARSKEYLEQSQKILAKGERPQIMCPLNENGLCILYKHRLLVCRTHGVPARMRRPDGQTLEFPGCFRCQEIVAEREKSGLKTPRVDRTKHLTELVNIESELLEFKRHLYPRVKLCIAEMIVKEFPTIPTPHCER
ncbi:hypothetical protein [Desulfosediminicola sp.]|uniref:hypothetical protein n=1 Tax=Desulfosediminicola sp. TaxID=2886825 RepID=UPI003AF22347